MKTLNAREAVQKREGDKAARAKFGPNAPLVSFTENGHPVSYVDTGTVLNTFGYDFISGSSDGNESINWNVIGTVANRDGSSTPEPFTLALLAAGLLCGILCEAGSSASPDRVPRS